MSENQVNLVFHAIRKGNFVNFLLTGNVTGFRAFKENGETVQVSISRISGYEVKGKNFKLTTFLTYNDKEYEATITGRVSEDIASGKIKFSVNNSNFE